MIFSDQIIDLGQRRVSSVWLNADGNLDFVFADQSRLVYSKLVLAPQPYFLEEHMISYADDCFILDNGKLHRRGECEYVKD